MTALELEVALMRHFNIRQNIVVPNLSHSMLRYEADIVRVTSSGYGTEVEIKVSKSDLLADFKKEYYHNSELFKFFYYAVPEDMEEFALEHIPQRAGLFVGVRSDFWWSEHNLVYIKEVRKARTNPDHRRWTEEEMSYLNRLGCMRILGLKESILKAQKEK
jgi:hypothetical protein